MVAYELWETQTGNLMAWYDTAEQALRVVSETARRHGPSSVSTFALVRVDDDGEIETVTDGSELLEQACRLAIVDKIGRLEIEDPPDPATMSAQLAEAHGPSEAPDR